jgi:hypothetical protein
MKTKILSLSVVTLMLGLILDAQQTKPKNQDHANLTHQQMCYQQARQYVADENVTRSKLNDYDNSLYGFSQAHYDPKTQTCYAEIGRSQPSFPPEATAYGTIETIEVVDAFEGKTIAFFVDGFTQDKKTGKLAWAEPSACQVNGEKCTSRPTFNYLLWKLIPAFRPVTATGDK